LIIYDCPMRCVLLAVACALVGACAAPAPQNERADPGAGFAFGAFDVTGSDIAVTHVVLVRISPTKVYMGGSGERTTVTYRNGEFYSPNLSPGVYSVTSFYSGNTPFGLEGGLRGNTFRVEAGGIAYAGTYRLNYKRRGVLQRDDASFERVDSRDAETRLLRWLAKELAATDWAPRLRSRLGELEKRPR
jgi:hypothetical protein